MLLWCLFLGLGVVFGSPGDRSPYFRGCRGRCEGGCPPGGGTTADGTAFTYPEAVLQWSCEEDCVYACMWRVEREMAAAGYPPVKYFGKWPFRRVLGVQELASSAFSLGNMLPHVVYLAAYREAYAPAHYRLAPLWLGFSWMGVWTWTWSTVFHARDTWWTERLDYHGATALLLYSLFAAVVRVFHLRRLGVAVAGVLCAAALGGVVWYLNVVKFDYGLNMVVALATGASSSAVWVYWAWRDKRPYRYKAVLFVVCLHAAAGFEVLDFPPRWGLVDAHAVWHFITIFLGFLWYSFLCDDNAYEAQQVKLE